MRKLDARIERFETAQPFVIARGVKTHVDVLLVEIRDGDRCGRGEGTPIYYLGDTPELALAAVLGVADAIRARAGRAELLELLPPGAARNAADSALWDLEAKQAGQRASVLAGLPAPSPIETAFTISLDTPGRMAEAARQRANYPLLKLKLGGEGDVDRVAAVRAAVPETRLIADANEGWEQIDIEQICSKLLPYRLELIEQPLPVGRDEQLRHMRLPIPLAADESLQDLADLDEVAGKYQLINIKLDKCGGLTAALVLAAEAKVRGLGQLCGCMLSTSLGVAPAFLVAMQGSYADLDGPLLLRADRPHGLRFCTGTVSPPEVALWG